MTPFDPPGATCSLSTSSTCSASIGINPAGTITGTYQDASFAVHGFLRTRDGTFTTFDAPGSAGTEPSGINPAGAITGAYFSTFLISGFLRTPGGTFITFNPPNSTSTAPVGSNPVGAIAGQYFVFLARPQNQGFLRGRDGSFITFNPPNSTYTNPVGINPEGAITGWYIDASSVVHGFLRTRDGTLITIDAPGAGTGSFEGTVAAGINAGGTITGHYSDANFNSHGFLRTRAGNFTTFDPRAPMARPSSPASTTGGQSRETTLTQQVMCFTASCGAPDIPSAGRALDGLRITVTVLSTSPTRLRFV